MKLMCQKIDETPWMVIRVFAVDRNKMQALVKGFLRLARHFSFRSLSALNHCSLTNSVPGAL